MGVFFFNILHLLIYFLDNTVFVNLEKKDASLRTLTDLLHEKYSELKDYALAHSKNSLIKSNAITESARFWNSNGLISNEVNVFLKF